MDLTASGIADPCEIAERLAAGEWVVDLRNGVAFSPGAAAVRATAAGQPGSGTPWERHPRPPAGGDEVTLERTAY